MPSTKKTARSQALSGEVLPPTPRINLCDAETIRQEMARVYREAKGGKRDTADASRLIYILSQILKAYELGVVEKRLAELEQATTKRKIK